MRLYEGYQIEHCRSNACSDQHLVFSTILDQNTTLEDFNDQVCHVLRDKVDLCLKALKNGTSYEEELRKANKGNTNDNNGDMPF